MWQLGNALLEKHFSALSDGRQPVGVRIRYEDVDTALGILTQIDMAAPTHSTPVASGDRMVAVLDALERLIVSIDALAVAIHGSSSRARPE